MSAHSPQHAGKVSVKNIIIFVVLLIGAGIAMWVFKRKTSTIDPNDPNAFMPALASNAVKFAASRGVNIDYSPDSVERVESLLAELHHLKTEGLLKDHDLNIHAHQFGAYIGEVLRRKYGGHWEVDSEVAGPKTFPMHWKESTSFPVGWCGKRILNGEDENVWHKYLYVTSDERMSGSDTLLFESHPKNE